MGRRIRTGRERRNRGGPGGPGSAPAPDPAPPGGRGGGGAKSGGADTPAPRREAGAGSRGRRGLRGMGAQSPPLPGTAPSRAPPGPSPPGSPGGRGPPGWTRPPSILPPLPPPPPPLHRLGQHRVPLRPDLRRPAVIPRPLMEGQAQPPAEIVHHHRVLGLRACADSRPAQLGEERLHHAIGDATRPPAGHGPHLVEGDLPGGARAQRVLGRRKPSPQELPAPPSAGCPPASPDPGRSRPRP